MISIPGSLSFAKLVMMSSTPAKSAGDASYSVRVPRSIHSLTDHLSHTISTPIRISTAFFLHQMQQVLPLFLQEKTHTCTHTLAQVSFVSPDLRINCIQAFKSVNCIRQTKVRNNYTETHLLTT